ncbi:hypothetical protein PR001_g27724 [Phytophthora rubi]|uniref:Tyr recombinase domain-containing protein n=1 Tax=Phytophthora rubi TaxID=129364 RepID=A0A6A3HKN9_9STRA|nr:hypothetical protein PR001_g27724 [Phytophthora rubi]
MRCSSWLSAADINKNAEQLGAFAVYLWKFGMNRKQTGNTYSTICSKLCAVRWFHKNTAGYDPGVNASHAILLRGIRRFSDPVVKQQPLTARLLRMIFGAIDLTQPRDQLLWGGLLLGYFFLLRRSEYLFIGRKVHSYILRLSAIRFFGDNEQSVEPKQARVVGVTLNGAENNQFGREEIRYHGKSGDKVICPVRAARWVLKAAIAFGTNPGGPALSMRKRGISAEDISKTIKRAASRSGLDPARFSTHSVRIGGATALLNAGADRLVIKLLGRWLSNAFEDYPVLSAKGTQGLSQQMC